MQALTFASPDQPAQLISKKTPAPQGHDVLVAIEAVAVNPVDLKIKSMLTAESSDKILGWDAAGTIIAVGDLCHQLSVGDRVFYAGDIGRDGCYATHQLVDSRIVGKVPQSIRIEQAAAFPLTSLTAWESLFDRLKIEPEQSNNKTLLIIGAAGGVGSIAIQLAKQLTQLTVVATASRSESHNWCQKMGADVVISHQGSLPDNYRATNLPAPDYILCLNDSDYYYPLMVELLAPQGLISLAVSFTKPVDLNLLKNKSAGLVWEFMFTRPNLKTADIDKQGKILTRIAEMIDAKQLQSIVNQHFEQLSVKTLQQAHDLLKTGKTIGKITLGAMPDA